jgi:hypothetical protein
LEITAGLGQEIHRVERLLPSCIGRAPVPRLAADCGLVAISDSVAQAAPELAQWTRLPRIVAPLSASMISSAALAAACRCLLDTVSHISPYPS